MLDVKTQTLLVVAEQGTFTKAAQVLSLTQPAVSHHINQLEDELGVKLIIRGKGRILLTHQGEIALNYAKRVAALYKKMQLDIDDSQRHITKLRIGITHTAESNAIPEGLAKYSSECDGVSITVITDTINNLYNMIENYELDLAIVEGKPHNQNINFMMLDTDYLVCVMSNNNPLAKKTMVTLNELKREKMILRLPSSASRILFESTLESIDDSINSFNVIMEVDNIATIKDLIRKDFGISILAKSACMDELRKGKITALPIENLSMIRETNIVYNKDFPHTKVLNDIARVYHEISRL